MVGLMPQQSQEQPPVAPEVDYQGEPNVTPEEQSAYERFVDNGLKVISDEGMAPQILKRIGEAENKADGLAGAAVSVVTTLQQSAQQNGREISPDILLHGGMELMEAIAQMATAFGVHEFDEKQIESAVYIAMDQYGTQAVGNGTLNKEALAQDVDELQRADQAGDLDSLFGAGFTEQAGKLQTGEQ